MLRIAEEPEGIKGRGQAIEAADRRGDHPFGAIGRERCRVRRPHRRPQPPIRRRARVSRLRQYQSYCRTNANRSDEHPSPRQPSPALDPFHSADELGPLEFIEALEPTALPPQSNDLSHRHCERSEASEAKGSRLCSALRAHPRCGLRWSC